MGKCKGTGEAMEQVEQRCCSQNKKIRGKIANGII